MIAAVVRYFEILRGNDAVAAVAHDDDGEIFWEILQTWDEIPGSQDVSDEDRDRAWTLAATWSLAIRRALAFEIEHEEKGLPIRPD